MTVLLPEHKQIGNDKSQYRARARAMKKIKKSNRESITFWWINTEILNFFRWLFGLLHFSLLSISFFFCRALFGKIPFDFDLIIIGIRCDSTNPCTVRAVCIIVCRAQKTAKGDAAANWLCFNSIRFQAFVLHIDPSIVLLYFVFFLHCFWRGLRIFNTSYSIFGFVLN